MKSLLSEMKVVSIRLTIFSLLIFLFGCSLPGPTLRPSDQITAGNSNNVPNGLVEWCNTLDTETFYSEPECMWYCRIYSRTEVKKQDMKSKAKAEITSCELR